jgi:hypothetical protein
VHDLVHRLVRIALLFLFGCSGKLVPVIPEGISADYAFAVVAEEAPLTVSEPFAIDAGDLTMPIHVDAYLDRQRVFLIALDRTAIERALPSFDPSRELRLRIAPPPDAPSFDPSARTALIRTPSDARLFLLEDDRFREAEETDRVLFSELALEIPYDPDACDPGLSVEPFAQIATTGNGFFEDFIEVARLSEDRVLALARGAMYLLDRGAGEIRFEFEPPPGTVYSAATGLDVDRSADPPLAFVTALTRPMEDGELGAIWTFEILDRELRLIDTTTGSTALFDVAVDRERRAIAVGALGAVYVRAPGGSFTPGPPLEVFAGDRTPAQRVVAIDSVDRPHFAGSPNRLYLGDVTQSGVAYREIQIATQEVLDVIDLAAGAGSDPDLFAVTRPPRLFHRPNGGSEFSAVPIDLPSELLPCAGAEETLPTEFAGVAAIEGGALTLPACTSLLFVREDDCGAVVRFPDSPIAPASDDGAIDAFENWITVGTERGRIWDVVSR